MVTALVPRQHGFEINRRIDKDTGGRISSRSERSRSVLGSVWVGD